jgi:hypothetical protein
MPTQVKRKSLRWCHPRHGIRVIAPETMEHHD